MRRSKCQELRNSIPMLNTEISWDSSNLYGKLEADGIKVATHEAGHLLGLGHTGHSPAIMRQGQVSYESAQPDDFNGLWSIYPGYYPSGNQ
jgi:predicted Zn-dependent protease